MGRRARCRVPPETTRTLMSVAPTDQSSGANPLEQRVAPHDRPERRSPSRPMARRWCSARSGAASQQLYARAMDQLGATPMLGHERWEQSVFLARRSMGRLFGGRRTQEGSARRRTGGDTVRRAVRSSGRAGAATGQSSLRSPERGLVARAGRREALPRRSRPFSRASTATGCPTCCPAAAPSSSRSRKGRSLWDDTQIVVRSLETGKQTVLVTGGSDGRYVSTGHLVYVRLGTLMAVPFDPVRLAVIGGATGRDRRRDAGRES